MVTVYGGVPPRQSIGVGSHSVGIRGGSTSNGSSMPALGNARANDSMLFVRPIC